MSLREKFVLGCLCLICVLASYSYLTHDRVVIMEITSVEYRGNIDVTFVRSYDFVIGFNGKHTLEPRNTYEVRYIPRLIYNKFVEANIILSTKQREGGETEDD